MSARIVDGNLLISTPNNLNKFKKLSINVAIMGGGYKDHVTRGENSGRLLSSDFVVLKHIHKTVNKKYPWRIKLPRVDTTQAKKLSLAAWFSDHKNKPIQAVAGWIDKKFLKREY